MSLGHVCDGNEIIWGVALANGIILDFQQFARNVFFIKLENLLNDSVIVTMALVYQLTITTAY